MLDREAFVRPIAHRGLHDASRGIVENSAPAFEAAIAAGVGIECDLRPAASGWPVVFHDETLDRLTDTSGDVASLDLQTIRAVRLKSGIAGILTFAEFLNLVSGRVPLLVEVKSEWGPPDMAFLGAIARQAESYQGPLALMSFDPAVMLALRGLAPNVPRGIVSGSYRDAHREIWWRDKIDEARADRLARLRESAAVEPDFYAYHVKDLPTAETRHAREVLRLPLFTWTVRSDEDRRTAADWADAPIFEGRRP